MDSPKNPYNRSQEKKTYIKYVPNVERSLPSTLILISSVLILEILGVREWAESSWRREIRLDKGEVSCPLSADSSPPYAWPWMLREVSPIIIEIYILDWPLSNGNSVCNFND